MKKLQTLTLAILLATAGITLEARHRHNFTDENYDQIHHLDKTRNDNDYDGSQITTADEHDAYDTAHHLDKHRNHHNENSMEHEKLQQELEQKPQMDTPKKVLIKAPTKKMTMKNKKAQTWAEYFNSLI